MAAGDTTQNMIATVRHRLGDPGGLRWSEEEIIYYLNATQREVVDLLCDSALYALTDVDSTALVAGTSTYDLPSGFVRQRRVVYKDDDATLWPLEQARALRQNAHHEQSETSPYYVIWDGKLEFFVGSGGVTQDNGDTYELWHIEEPTELTTSTDPDFGDHFRNLIEQGAVARALEQGDAGDFERARWERSVFEMLCEIVNMHYGEVPSFGGIPNDPMPLRGEG